MIRGALRSLFVVVVIAGTAAAEESPVQVVDRPVAQAPSPAAKTAKVKTHKAKHKTKHKARKHKKAHHGHRAPAPTPE